MFQSQQRNVDLSPPSLRTIQMEVQSGVHLAACIQFVRLEDSKILFFQVNLITLLCQDAQLACM